MPRLRGRQRRRNVQVRRRIEQYEKQRKRLIIARIKMQEERRKRIKILLAKRREEDRKREISEPRVREYFDLRKAAEIRRKHELLYRVGYSIATIVNYPTRLINHVYCKTSSAVYIYASKILEVPLDRIKGLYSAVETKVWRWRRPMVRSSRIADRDVEDDKRSLRNIAVLLKKTAQKAITRIIKLIGRITSRLQEITLIKTIKGYYRTATAIELAIRASLLERIYAIRMGYREYTFFRAVRHCSAYAYIQGLRYTGLPSGWYYWKRRYRICDNLCAVYTGYDRGMCYSYCEDILAELEPHNAGYGLQYAQQVIDAVMSRVTG